MANLAIRHVHRGTRLWRIAHDVIKPRMDGPVAHDKELFLRFVAWFFTSRAAVTAQPLFVSAWSRAVGACQMRSWTCCEALLMEIVDDTDMVFEVGQRHDGIAASVEERVSSGADHRAQAPCAASAAARGSEEALEWTRSQVECLAAAAHCSQEHEEELL